MRARAPNFQTVLTVLSVFTHEPSGGRVSYRMGKGLLAQELLEQGVYTVW
jgi:hypothetical protein